MVVVFCLWITEILWDNHSHKSYWATLSFGAVYDGPAVCSLEWDPRVWLFTETLLRSNFPVRADSWSGFATFFAIYFDRSQIKRINLIASTQCSQKLHALKFSFLHGTFINLKWYQIFKKKKNWCESLQFSHSLFYNLIFHWDWARTDGFYNWWDVNLKTLIIRDVFQTEDLILFDALWRKLHYPWNDIAHMLL